MSSTYLVPVTPSDSRPGSFRAVVPERLACPSCEVLTTDDLNVPCWCCGGPLILATTFRNPASRALRHPLLAMIANPEEF